MGQNFRSGFKPKTGNKVPDLKQDLFSIFELSQLYSPLHQKKFKKLISNIVFKLLLPVKCCSSIANPHTKIKEQGGQLHTN